MTRSLFRKPSSPPPSPQELAELRGRMVEQHIRHRGVKDERVLRAMCNVERHRFLAEHQWPSAYGDHPLPIGEDQTISQPYIVALMSEALRLQGKERVLEVGTGSGYQTAILAELAGEVFTVEIRSSLSERARRVLGELGYRNIHYRVGDGRQGWPEQAPYEAILVTAAPPEVPETLRSQLAERGRLVIPVGALNQDLELHTRRGDTFTVRQLASVRFVPLK